LVDNWNKTVSKTDTVLHLGDFTSDDTANALEEKIRKYGNLLHGRILLIRGNHDTAHSGVYETTGIELVNEFKNPWYNAATGTIKNKKILFSHYPIKDIYTILNETNIIQGINYAQLLDENPFKFSIEQLEEIFIKNKFEINIHGHIHNEIKIFDNLINVSPANIGYKPVRLEELLKTRGQG
jgi:calcineurin-like phosphoesterase family protein